MNDSSHHSYHAHLHSTTDAGGGNMKTPDEVKKGLEQCVKAESGETGCGGCPYVLSCVKEEDPDSIIADALAYIEQLESRLAQVERERDAAVKDIGISCDYCAYADYHFGEAPCITLEEYELGKLCSGWKWRGVCAENTREE